MQKCSPNPNAKCGLGGAKGVESIIVGTDDKGDDREPAELGGIGSDRYKVGMISYPGDPLVRLAPRQPAQESDQGADPHRCHHVRRRIPPAQVAASSPDENDPQHGHVPPADEGAVDRSQHLHRGAKSTFGKLRGQFVCHH
jgi:hypothetical protein